MLIIFLAQQHYYSVLRNMNTDFEAYKYSDLLGTLTSSQELLESTAQHSKYQTEFCSQSKRMP